MEQRDFVSQSFVQKHTQHTTLTKVTAVASACIEDKMSLIPVWDSTKEGKTPKTPCLPTWKKHQTNRMTIGEFYTAMEHYDTFAFAVVAGEASGRLECIDIDSKYEPGIEVLLLKDIQEIKPELFSILRIHGTPSGGMHIIYRIKDHEVPANDKLAGRPKTEDELLDDRKRGQKKPQQFVNFLETRGEGGYFLYPPSLGYSIVKDVPIPEITWEERCALINICKLYDRVIKHVPIPKPTKFQDSQYITNPFEDFNYRCDAVNLMTQNGWKVCPKGNPTYTYFTRPGKDKDVSASFNNETRIFTVFTTSSDLEPKGYNPSSLLSEFLHNGDKKQTFKYLIENGFGKLKESVEKEIVNKAIHQQSNGPANLSDEAKKSIKLGIENNSIKYPYGIMWEFDDKGKVNIPINLVLQVLVGLGFRSHHGKVVRAGQDPNIINTRINDPLNEIITSLIDYVKEDDGDTYTSIVNAIDEKFSTKAKYIRERLPNLDNSQLLADEVNASYICYSNCIIEVTSDGIKQHDYTFLTEKGLYVLDKNVAKRSYYFDVAGSELFRDFLINALGFSNYVKKVLGYLAHKGKRENSTFLVVQTERVANTKDGGGSGKNVTTGMLNHFNSIYEVDGSSAKVDATLTQGWSDEGIVVISDVKRNFPYAALKNAITNNMLCKRLYQNLTIIPFKESPKFIVSTNYSYDTGDGGLDRRIRPLEYTDFYSKQGGVDKYHGKLFPDDFTEEDWKGFDDVMIECLQTYFQANGVIEKIELSDTGKIKQMNSKYGEMVMDQFEELVEDLIQNIPFGFIKNLKSAIKDLSKQGYSWGQKIEQMSSQEKYGVIEFISNDRGFEFKKNHKKEYNNSTGAKEWVYEFIKLPESE
ncbi:bifunctional DNA primase/polymerase [Sphingobacterium lactis]|uniref:bifunctional DNA primase/polymerase n=1 Tax=Sphingobacterium lactis TaxID=797291 RepID=UPI003EC550E2